MEQMHSFGIISPSNQHYELAKELNSAAEEARIPNPEGAQEVKREMSVGLERDTGPLPPQRTPGVGSLERGSNPAANPLDQTVFCRLMETIQVQQEQISRLKAVNDQMAAEKKTETTRLRSFFQEHLVYQETIHRQMAEKENLERVIRFLGKKQQDLVALKKEKVSALLELRKTIQKCKRNNSFNCRQRSSKYMP